MGMRRRRLRGEQRRALEEMMTVAGAVGWLDLARGCLEFGWIGLELYMEPAWKVLGLYPEMRRTLQLLSNLQGSLGCF